MTGRSPVIDAGDSSLAANVMYVADNDGLVYAIATDTGQILWVVNPTGLTTNGFTGAPSVQVKSFSDSMFTPLTTYLWPAREMALNHDESNRGN